MKFTVIGCSPAWPNPGSAQSGYLIESDAGRVLVDCGPGVLSRLRTYEAWPRLDAIAITHFHLDHWGDLVGWVWGSMYRAGSDAPAHRPELWVHPGGRDILRRLGEQLGFADMFERVFTLMEYPAGGPFTAGGFEIQPVRLPHYTIETYGFRLSAGGTTLAYSGDSGPSPRLADLARNADLFVCEATLRGTQDDGEPRGHLSADEAIAAAEAGAARRLLLTHRPSELALPAGIERAHDGLVLEL